MPASAIGVPTKHDSDMIGGRASSLPADYLSSMIRQSSMSLTLGVFIGSAMTSGIACGVLAAYLANERLLRRLRGTLLEMASAAREAVLVGRAPVADRRKTIVFVRHAQSLGNVQAESGRADQCLRDAPLSDFGRAQAEEGRARLALALEQGGSTQRHWLLASSPLTRALETAELIWPPGVRVARRAVAAELREFLIDRDDIGTPRGTLLEQWPALRDEIASLRDEVWWTVEAGGAGEPPDVATPGVDGWARVAPDGNYEIVDTAHCEQRVEAALAWMASQPETHLVVVCHAALLGMITERLGLGRWGFPNAGVFRATEVDLDAFRSQQ